MPHAQRLAHVLLGYEPTYTSYLQKRKKKTKEQLAAERAGPSKKRKRSSFKGKSVAIEVSSATETDLHGSQLQDLIGRVRVPLEVEFEEEEEEEQMAGDLGDLPSLVKKPKRTVTALVKGTPSQSKRAPAATETDPAELKKQRLVLASGSGKVLRKDKNIAENTVAQKDPPPRITNAEASVSTPFIFAPQVREGTPVLVTDSVRSNPRLGLPMLQGVCLPEDMTQVPSDLEGNIVEMFSHLTLVCTTSERSVIFMYCLYVAYTCCNS